MFKSIVWSSTIDYPEQVSTVLFVGTCNWNCEYCYNRNLNSNKSIDFDIEILPRLLDRKDFIDHVVISGGECTCYKELESVIDKLNHNGFTVGIHTNGSNPDVLEKVIDKISFVGMDIKCNEYELHSDFNNYNANDIEQSINLILHNNIESEFRTTLFPKYFNDVDSVVSVAKKLERLGVKQYTLQEYQQNDLCNIEPFPKNIILKIVDKCNKVLPTELKGYIK